MLVSFTTIMVARAAKNSTVVMIAAAFNHSVDNHGLWTKVPPIDTGAPRPFTLTDERDSPGRSGKGPFGLHFGPHLGLSTRLETDPPGRPLDPPHRARARQLDDLRLTAAVAHRYVEATVESAVHLVRHSGVDEPGLGHVEHNVGRHRPAERDECAGSQGAGVQGGAKLTGRVAGGQDDSKGRLPGVAGGQRPGHLGDLHPFRVEAGYIKAHFRRYAAVIADS